MGENLYELLATHDGVITRAQAVGLGMSSSAIGRLTGSGAWARMGQGVYFATDRSMSERARMRIACATTGPCAVLSGPAAAWWHRLVNTSPPIVSVTTPRGRHPTSPRGVRVTHRDLHPADVIERADLVVTAVPLTVLEAATVDGIAVLDAALLRGRVSMEQLTAAHQRYPGRRGAGISAQMLRVAGSGARSEAERVLIALLRGAGIGGWRANHPVCGYAVDVAFPDHRVLVEIDGLAFHSDAHAFQHDRTRQNVLVADGWTLLRFTWADLTERPELVVTQIRDALGQT